MENDQKPVWILPSLFAAGVPRCSMRRVPHFHSPQQTLRSTPPRPTSNKVVSLEDRTAMSHPPRSHTPAGSRVSTVPSQKPRQLSHLQAQLAQLTANMADLESLVRMTAGQAQDMRGLGGYSGAM
jgi:hypothetical protein